MKVKIKRSIAGTEFSYYPGQEIDIDEDLARKWQESGIAEPIGLETASIEPPERAVLPAPRRKAVK